jgi:hypothetical protein
MIYQFCKINMVGDNDDKDDVIDVYTKSVNEYTLKAKY